jgi:hypothetical protein
MDVNSNSGDSVSQQGDQTQNLENGQNQVDTPNLGAIRKSGQQEVLGALGKVLGQNFSKTNDAIAYIEQLTRNNNGGSVSQESRSNNSNKSGGEMAELRSMIQGLQSQLEQKDQAVRRTTLQSQIKETAIRTGFDANMLDIATGLFESQIDFDENGNFYVKGANGSVKLDGKGNPYTIEALAQDILRSRPKLAADEGRSGTGSKFGQGVGRSDGEIPDASTDLEGWKKWKEQQGIGQRSFKGLAVSVNKPII